MTAPALASRLAGAVWGHLVGDAMGVPYEFRPPSAIGEVRWGERGTHGRPPGTWSDDGALSLALLDSLLPDQSADPPRPGGFDPADQARRFLAWRRDGAYTPDGEGLFDIGNATREALERLERGVPPEEAGALGPRSLGNGSLMRILPVALTAVEPQVRLPELIERAHRASRVTHRHPVCQVACAWHVVAARDLLRGDTDPERALDIARKRLGAFYAGAAGTREAMPDHIDALAQVDAHTERQGRGGAVDCFWSAWDSLAASDSYAATVERAIRYGNDTDTTAAVAGGLAGLRWGLDGIPPEWLAGMRGREVVEPIVDRLLELHAGRP